MLPFPQVKVGQVAPGVVPHRLARLFEFQQHASHLARSVAVRWRGPCLRWLAQQTGSARGDRSGRLHAHGKPPGWPVVSDLPTGRNAHECPHVPAAAPVTRCGPVLLRRAFVAARTHAVSGTVPPAPLWAKVDLRGRIRCAGPPCHWATGAKLTTAPRQRATYTPAISPARRCADRQVPFLSSEPPAPPPPREGLRRRSGAY